MGVLAGKPHEIRQLGWTAVNAVRSIRDLDSALSMSRVSELQTHLSLQYLCDQHNMPKMICFKENALPWHAEAISEWSPRLRKGGC